MENKKYKLTDRELAILSSVLMYTQDKKNQLTNTVTKLGNFSIQLDEFKDELHQIRRPLYDKDFSSEFLDKVLMGRLDTFNPTKYLGTQDSRVEIEDYLYMLTINIRVLKDLELEVLKGNSVV